MTFQQLHYIVEAASLGSITKVAQNNHIVQSSVSTEIHALEDELGIRIFERHNKGVRPTAEGMNFISNACSLLEHRDQVLNAISSSDKQHAISHLSISSQRYTYTVDAFVSFFKNRNPDMYAYRIQEKAFSEVLEDVSCGLSDIGVVLLSKSTYKLLLELMSSQNLQFTELSHTPQSVILGRHHPLADKPAISISELLVYPYITFINDTNDTQEPLNILGYRRPEKSIVVSDRAIARTMLLHTDAYTIGSGALVKGCAEGELVAIPAVGVNNQCISGWVKKATREMTSEMTDFVNYLHQTCGSAL